MSREAYKKDFYVYDSETCIPIANQIPYTLNQAVARLNREVKELHKLFPKESRRELEELFEIRNFKTGERVL